MNNLGLIGRKIGMSREFFPIGISVPVTVIKVEKGRIIDLISKETRGYNAVRVGFGKVKSSKLNKPMKGFFSKKSTEPKKFLKEYTVNDLSKYKEGNEIGLEIFKDVKFIDVTSKTIGKGFAGPMKRHNFSGLRASHGVSVSHRSHGSTGQRQDPGKVFKNKKMAGHMGDKYRTMHNLEVIKSDLNNNLIYIRGSVPGSKNTIVYLRSAIKRIKKQGIVERFEKNIKSRPEEKKDKVTKKAVTSEKKTEPKKEVKKEAPVKTDNKGKAK